MNKVPDVGFHHSIELVQRSVFNSTLLQNAGVIYQHVNPTKERQRRMENTTDVLFVCQVACSNIRNLVIRCQCYWHYFYSLVGCT